MMANDVLKMLKVVIKKKAFQALDFGVPNFGNKPKWSFDISSARISIRIISPRDSWYPLVVSTHPMGSETWGNHGKPKVLQC